MKKRVLSILSAGLLLLSATACGTNADSVQAAGAQAAGTDPAVIAEPANETTPAAATEDTNSAAPETAGEAVPYQDTGIEITSTDTKVIIGDQGYYVTPIIEHFGWYDTFLRDKGIEVEQATFNSGPEMIETFTAGGLDWGVMGLQPAVSGAANEAGVQVLASFVDQSRATVLATLDDSIKTVSDLKGKRVGAKIGSSEYAFLLWALQEEGLSAADVDIINLDIPAIAPAVESGEVDAGTTNINNFTRVASADGITFNYIKDAVGSGTALQPIVVRTEFAQAHPDVVETILTLYKWGIDWIAENHDEAVQIIADYYGTGVDVPETVLTYQTYGFAPLQEFLDSTENYITFLYDGGYISTRVETDGFVDLSYGKAVGLE